jgi:activator of HSP90 ATPase
VDSPPGRVNQRIQLCTTTKSTTENSTPTSAATKAASGTSSCAYSTAENTSGTSASATTDAPVDALRQLRLAPPLATRAFWITARTSPSTRSNHHRGRFTAGKGRPA